MSYVTRDETGTSTSTPSHPGIVLLRKLTQSQGARSDVYDTRETTGKELTISRRGSDVSQTPTSSVDTIPAPALNEHLDRLLRECREKAEDLVEACEDPVRSALAGSTLTNLVTELWGHRAAREDDWTELLNVIQIVLAKLEFETLPIQQRSALLTVFRDGLSPHHIGPSDVRRSLEALTGAGFDMWRGLQDFEPTD